MPSVIILITTLIFQYDNSSIRIFYDRGPTCQNASIYDDSFKILHDGSLDLNGSRLSYKSFCINFVETLEKGKKKSFSFVCSTNLYFIASTNKTVSPTSF